VIELRLFEDGSRARLIGPDALHRGHRRIQAGLGHRHLFLPLGVIESGKDLAGLNPVILVREHLGEPALNFRTDRGFEPRFERAGAHDFGHHGSECDLMRNHGSRPEFQPVAERPGQCGCDQKFQSGTEPAAN